MAQYKQSTAYTRTFFMVSSTDHISAKTGAAPVVNLGKAGAAFGAAGGTVTEISNGWYKIVLTTTDTNTTGDLSYHITGTGADDTDFVDQIIAVDLLDATAFGLSRLDAAITTRMATYTQPTGFLAATFPATVASPTNITAGTITTTTNLTNLPSIPANWLTAAGIAASALNGKGDWPLNTDYTVARAGKLDNLDATISSRSTYAGGDTSGTTTLLARLTAGRATNLDNLDATISSRSTYAGTDTAGTTTLLARLTAGRATNLDNLDATVSSRSTYAGTDSAGTTTLLTRLTAGRATNLDNLDVAVSTRSTYAGTMVDANIKQINSVPIDGSGTSGSPWGP